MKTILVAINDRLNDGSSEVNALLNEINEIGNRKLSATPPYISYSYVNNTPETTNTHRSEDNLYQFKIVAEGELKALEIFELLKDVFDDYTFEFSDDYSFVKMSREGTAPGYNDETGLYNYNVQYRIEVEKQR